MRVHITKVLLGVGIGTGIHVEQLLVIRFEWGGGGHSYFVMCAVMLE